MGGWRHYTLPPMRDKQVNRSSTGDLQLCGLPEIVVRQRKIERATVSLFSGPLDREWKLERLARIPEAAFFSEWLRQAFRWLGRRWAGQKPWRSTARCVPRLGRSWAGHRSQGTEASA